MIKETRILEAVYPAQTNVVPQALAPLEGDPKTPQMLSIKQIEQALSDEARDDQP